jgi:hypothetical protein
VQATAARKGVKKPIQSKNEIRAISETPTQYRVGEERSKGCVTFKANIAAVAILKNNNPTPGHREETLERVSAYEVEVTVYPENATPDMRLFFHPSFELLEVARQNWSFSAN